jgi:hypothetical protein
MFEWSATATRPSGHSAETAAAGKKLVRKPLADWPAPVRVAVRIFSKRRSASDRGVGDTLARMFGGTGEAFKVWFFAVFGKSCRCEQRQAWLNHQFPYPQP